MPPLRVAAVKVTLVPAQTGLADGAMDMLTGNRGLTVIARELDMAGLPVAQVALDVSKQVITSVLTGTKE